MNNKKKEATPSELLTNADSYQINFPLKLTPNDKMILIIAVLMIEYQLFEESEIENSDESTSKRNGIHTRI